MLGDRNSGDPAAVRSAVPSAAIAPVASLPARITGRGEGRVRPFAERIFSLSVKKVLGNNKRAMAAPAGGRSGGSGGGGGRGGKGRYDRTFEEENSCKQPLLVKVWLYDTDSTTSTACSVGS